MMSGRSNRPLTEPQTKSKVDVVVQEYMDSLLSDLFPDLSPEEAVLPDIEPTEVSAAEETSDDPTIELTDAEENRLSEVNNEVVIETDEVPSAIEAEPEVEVALDVEVEPEPLTDPLPEITAEPVTQAQTLDTPLDEPAVMVEVAEPEPVFLAEVGDIATTQVPVETPPDVEVVQELDIAPSKPVVPRRYPNAPDWAQEPFEVLLFDVCGLKLGVPMEALGRIIKTKEEPHNIIGKPPWFMGAYDESEQRLYVVDTAMYIMPEKGFDMTELGFSYVIQLQRSRWTLACKEVQTTVRIEPEQVKWRSQDGKRPWLAGTIIDHMCALIHVDSLVDLLESEIKP